MMRQAPDTQLTARLGNAEDAELVRESADSSEVRLQVLEGDAFLGTAHPLRCLYTFRARQVLVEGLKELTVNPGERDVPSQAGAEQAPHVSDQQARIEALRALAREREQAPSAARAEARATERPRRSPCHGAAIPGGEYGWR